jgi:hypothetical protein
MTMVLGKEKAHNFHVIYDNAGEVSLGLCREMDLMISPFTMMVMTEAANTAL